MESQEETNQVPPGVEEKASSTDPELGQEKSQGSDVTKPEFDPPPDGGLQAWLVTVGAACITFSALGFTNAFGVFEEYYLSHQLTSKSPDDIAWIGSIAAFLQFAVGAVAGPIFDRYGIWVCLGSSFSGMKWWANTPADPPPSHPDIRVCLDDGQHL